MPNLKKEREKLKQLRDAFEKDEKSLKSMYDDNAKTISPFAIGDEIEYESNKKGKVNKIYFPSEPWLPLEEQEPDCWAVTGNKINKNGRPGKKDYHPVSNKTHKINGTTCRKNTLDETLGIK